MAHARCMTGMSTTVSAAEAVVSCVPRVRACSIFTCSDSTKPRRRTTPFAELTLSRMLSRRGERGSGIARFGRRKARAQSRLPYVAIFSILANSHSRLHSGHTERVFSQREMQSRWKTCPQQPHAML